MSERAYGWAARLSNILDSAGLPAGVYHPCREANLRLHTTVRLLQADLAIRLYQHDHGKLPESLDQLAPNYLPNVPLDAYCKQPLVYRSTGDDFLLYSVGIDRADNGGKFTNLRTYFARDSFGNLKSGYDYDLDTLTRP